MKKTRDKEIRTNHRGSEVNGQWHQICLLLQIEPAPHSKSGSDGDTAVLQIHPRK